MTNPHFHSTNVVNDGHDRLRAALEAEIRAAVMIEYAARREAASAWGRFWLRREINREVTRRLNEIPAPPNSALF